MPLSPSEFEQIRKIVQESSGIVLDPGKQMMVEQKLKSVADELGKGTPDAVAREVISSPRNSTAQALEGVDSAPCDPVCEGAGGLPGLLRVP